MEDPTRDPGSMLYLNTWRILHPHMIGSLSYYSTAPRKLIFETTVEQVAVNLLSWNFIQKKKDTSDFTASGRDSENLQCFRSWKNSDNNQAEAVVLEDVGVYIELDRITDVLFINGSQKNKHLFWDIVLKIFCYLQWNCLWHVTNTWYSRLTFWIFLFNQRH